MSDTLTSTDAFTESTGREFVESVGRERVESGVCIPGETPPMMADVRVSEFNLYDLAENFIFDPNRPLDAYGVGFVVTSAEDGFFVPPGIEGRPLECSRGRVESVSIGCAIIGFPCRLRIRVRGVVELLAYGYRDPGEDEVKVNTPGHIFAKHELPQLGFPTMVPFDTSSVEDIPVSPYDGVRRVRYTSKPFYRLIWGHIGNEIEHWYLNHSNGASRTDGVTSVDYTTEIRLTQDSDPLLNRTMILQSLSGTVQTGSGPVPAVMPNRGGLSMDGVEIVDPFVQRGQWMRVDVLAVLPGLG